MLTFVWFPFTRATKIYDCTLIIAWIDHKFFFIISIVTRVLFPLEMTRKFIADTGCIYLRGSRDKKRGKKWFSMRKSEYRKTFLSATKESLQRRQQDERRKREVWRTVGRRHKCAPLCRDFNTRVSRQETRLVTTNFFLIRRYIRFADCFVYRPKKKIQFYCAQMTEAVTHTQKNSNNIDIRMKEKFKFFQAVLWNIIHCVVYIITRTRQARA